MAWRLCRVVAAWEDGKAGCCAQAPALMMPHVIVVNVDVKRCPGCEPMGETCYVASEFNGVAYPKCFRSLGRREGWALRTAASVKGNS